MMHNGIRCGIFVWNVPMGLRTSHEPPSDPSPVLLLVIGYSSLHTYNITLDFHFLTSISPRSLDVLTVRHHVQRRRPHSDPYPARAAHTLPAGPPGKGTTPPTPPINPSAHFSFPTARCYHLPVPTTRRAGFPHGRSPYPTQE